MFGEKVGRLASNILEKKTFKSIRRGLMYSMPIILIGSVASLLLNLPVAFFQNFMDNLFGAEWRELFLHIHNGTFQIMSIIVLISIAYNYVVEDEYIQKVGLNPLLPVLIVFGGYFCSILMEGKVILMEKQASATGLFQAIVLSIVVSKLFLYLYKHKWLHLKVLTNDTDMVLNQTLGALLPAFLTLFIVAFFRIVVSHFGIDEWIESVYWKFTGFAASSGQRIFFIALLFDGVLDLLWFVGLHGSNILEAFNDDVFVSATNLNLELVSQGLEPTQIFTKQFFDVFVYIGGCGTTLALIIALIIKGKRSSTDKLASISIIPGIFNINELIVYGLPIVLNPFFLIPFVVTPVILLLTTYFAMFTGLVPLTQNTVVWTAPIGLGGYVATNSWRGAVLQLINLVIGVLIYLPFVNMYDVHKVKINRKAFRDLLQDIHYIKIGQPERMLDRHDEIGFFTRILVRDIREAIIDSKNPMHMEYQPKVDRAGRVVGCEALLRWEHEKYGLVPPPVIVTLANEAGLSNALGNWVIREVFLQKARWNKVGLSNFKVSFNVISEQLSGNEMLKVLEECLQRTGVPAEEMEIELTENMALDQSHQIRNVLKKVKDLGFHIAIDDFGMGHSSLLYIRDFFVDAVKIDGALVKDVVTDANSQEIITSITGLCTMLKLEVIAEFVETKEQRDVLAGLDCMIYQGYYYNRALKPKEFEEYYDQMRFSSNETLIP